MQNNNKLTSLIKHACFAVEMLGPMGVLRDESLKVVEKIRLGWLP